MDGRADERSNPKTIIKNNKRKDSYKLSKEEKKISKGNDIKDF